MDVGLRHLQFVVAAVRYGSLRRAATALHLKESTISRALRHLEERLGIVLFTRASGGVRPTAAGLELVVAAERLLGDFDGLIARAGALGRGATGHLVLGLPTSHAVARLCPVLIEQAHQRPEVDVQLIAKPKTALLVDLYAGALDVAVITGHAIGDGIESISLWSDQIMLAIPAAHALRSRGYATWNDLADEVVLGSSRGLGPELKDILSARLGAIGRQLAIEEHAIGGEALLSLVAAGRGVSLQCERVVSMPQAGFEMLELHDEAGPAWITYSACWKRESNNPALTSFLNLLRAHHSAVSLGRVPET